MEGVYNTDNKFDFSQLKLAKPQPIPGGNYFIRLSIAGKPLYIRHPKCKTKQGFFKAGKRFHTDLMFTHEDTNFIEWMENLENHCQNMLYENRDQWFEDSMEIHDIENYFTSPLKIFKSGKFYIARVNVSTNLGNPILKVYDEDENLIAMDKVDNKVDIMSVLEIKGIKCSATSFQIEMEVKQMMVMKPENIFDKCLFRTNSGVISSINVQNEDTYLQDNDPTDTLEQTSNLPNELQTAVLIEDVDEDKVLIDVEDEEQDIKQEQEEIILTNEDPGEKPLEHVENTLETFDNSELDNSIEKDNQPVENEIKENDYGLQEIEVSLDEIPQESSFTIKNKDNVYYQMYKEAKSKAKVARDLAITSYLEAKRIKNLYMLNDTSDSDDSDFENIESEENDISENIEDSS